MTKLALALVSILAAAACSGSGTMYSSGTVSAGVSYGTAPPLVEIQPGVWVVEEYDEPVFYADDYYWLYRGGGWYRSPYYDRGWVTTYEVPYRVRSIDRPTAYVRYRGSAGVRYRQGPRGRVQVRDHRDQDRSVYGTQRDRDRDRDRRYDYDRRRQQQIRDEQIRQRQLQEQRQREENMRRDARRHDERVRMQETRDEQIRQRRLQEQRQREENMRRDARRHEERVRQQEVRDRQRRQQVQQNEAARQQRQQERRDRQQQNPKKKPDVKDDRKDDDGYQR
jgi:hypothetical protein